VGGWVGKWLLGDVLGWVSLGGAVVCSYAASSQDCVGERLV
jgi:hypothetical protein